MISLVYDIVYKNQLVLNLKINENLKKTCDSGSENTYVFVFMGSQIE